jgi:glycosyltransferase involved in cell wall biosynthesis
MTDQSTAAHDSQGAAWPRSIGVYADLVYSRGREGLYSDMAFGEYIAALADRVERVTVFGRLDAERFGGDHLMGDRVEFVEFPFYRRVSDLAGVYRSLPGARRAFRATARELDAAWVFGPHPVSLALVREARRSGLPVMLGVRQDQPRYMRARLSGPRWLVGVPFFQYLELRWRRLARRLPTIVAGDDLVRIYGGGAKIRATAFSLVRASDLPSTPPEDRDGRFEIVSVGRLDPEKNPLLLAAIADALRRSDPDLVFRLRVVGDGPLAGALADEVRRLGLEEVVELAGYVPFGEKLDEIYRSSDLFLHVSHTEGLPQVLIEAMAAALPVVGTAVGGVPALLEPAGMPLVAPDDAAAAAGQVASLAGDRPRCRALALAALAAARDLTLERQQDAVLSFFRQETGR